MWWQGGHPKVYHSVRGTGSDRAVRAGRHEERAVAKASGTKRWLRAVAAASAAAAATGLLASWRLLARRHERSSEGVFEECGLGVLET